MVAKFRFVSVAGKKAAALQIPLGYDVHPRFFRITAEDQRGVGGHRQFPPLRRLVAQPEPLQAHGRSAACIDRHEDQQFLLDGVAVVLENRVTLPVPRAVGVHLAESAPAWATRRRRGRHRGCKWRSRADRRRDRWTTA